MSKIIFSLLACSFALIGPLSADVYVSPYTRRDGTQIQGHMRSDPNDTKSDNWSTKGNMNPYTGKPGTH